LFLLQRPFSYLLLFSEKMLVYSEHHVKHFITSFRNSAKVLNVEAAAMCVCICVCMYVCVYVCTYVCIYVCNACVYVCMYVMYVGLIYVMYSYVCIYVCMYE